MAAFSIVGRLDVRSALCRGIEPRSAVLETAVLPLHQLNMHPPAAILSRYDLMGLCGAFEWGATENHGQPLGWPLMPLLTSRGGSLPRRAQKRSEPSDGPNLKD